MSHSHETLREALGAYALGHLDDPRSPEDVALHDELVAHLATCGDCLTELAELAGVRSALDAIPDDDALRRPPPEVHPARFATPPGLDARIREALAREEGAREEPTREEPTRAVIRPPVGAWRRRRAVVAGAAAGLLVGAAAATTAVLVTRDPAPTSPVVVAVPSLTTADGVVATAGIVDHTWGLELRLRMTGLPGGRAYDVRVEDGTGREFDSGEFLGVTGTTITCSMSSSVLAADARHFEVLDPAGTVVIEGDLPT